MRVAAFAAAAFSAPLRNNQGWRASLVDVSKASCWGGGFTVDFCCHGDPTTRKECWSDGFQFGDCCPNADCWAESDFTYEQCCADHFGPGGNTQCWSDMYTYELCCKADASSGASTWSDALFRDVDASVLYAYDDFYTDAQYGPEFGYYSTGRVLMPGLGTKAGAEEFSQFTTFPMALAPHFGRVLCRSLLRMWLALDRPADFSVIEFGAGSGQLGWDITSCVGANELGLHPALAREFRESVRYQIIERSPALAARQRKRGLPVLEADAQDAGACKRIRDHVKPKAGAVISNELLDAFAPLRLRYTVYENDLLSCSAWQEVRILHVARAPELEQLLAERVGPEAAADMVQKLTEYSHTYFCEIVDSSVGKAAVRLVGDGETHPGACALVVIALNQLLAHTDLQLPLAAHNFRWRLRHDPELQARFRAILQEEQRLLGPPETLLVVQREQYKMLRRVVAQGEKGDVSQAITAELPFIHIFEARKIGAPLLPGRCKQVLPWIRRHKQRVARVVELYGNLGYASVDFVLRPGEEEFMKLADCLLPQGYMLSVDYGATFDALAHAMESPGNDGVVTSLMPIPEGVDFPDCHTEWTKCPGLVDWTSFVDFTNLAEAGEEIGWATDFYGPQNALESSANSTVMSRGEAVYVPGYSVLQRGDDSRIPSWYGRESFDDHQRWTGFKVLVQRKGAPAQRVVTGPSWHLDVSQMSQCWAIDFTDLPLADVLWRTYRADVPLRELFAGLNDDASDALNVRAKHAYDKAQATVQLIDWVVSQRGCNTAPVQDWGPWYRVWGSLTQEVGDAALAAVRTGRAVEPWECIAIEAYRMVCP